MNITPTRGGRATLDPPGDVVVTAEPAAFALRVGAGRPLALLAAVAALLTAISLAGQLLVVTGTMPGNRFLELATVFDLNSEANVPSWFQSGLLALCAGVLWTVGERVRRRGMPDERRWRLLSLVFVVLSLDELAALHEHLTLPVRGALHLSGLLTYSWVVVAVPVVALLGAFYLPFVRRLPRRTALGVVVAGAVYVTGAVLIEMIGGELVSLGDAHSVAYVVESTVEEIFEMSGLLLFLRTLDLYGQRVREAAPTR